MAARSVAADNHCACSRELMMRFALWAYGQVAIPERERIQAVFGVDRSTAYRWRRAYCTATGQPVPAARPSHDYHREPQVRRQPASPLPMET